MSDIIALWIAVVGKKGFSRSKALQASLGETDLATIEYHFQDAADSSIDNGYTDPCLPEVLCQGRVLGVALMKWIPYGGLLDSMNDEREVCVNAHKGNMATMQHFNVLEAFRFETPQVVSTDLNRISAPNQTFFCITDESCTHLLDSEVYTQNLPMRDLLRTWSADPGNTGAQLPWNFASLICCGSWTAVSFPSIARARKSCNFYHFWNTIRTLKVDIHEDLMPSEVTQEKPDLQSLLKRELFLQLSSSLRTWSPKIMAGVDGENLAFVKRMLALFIDWSDNCANAMSSTRPSWTWQLSMLRGSHYDVNSATHGRYVPLGS